MQANRKTLIKQLERQTSPIRVWPAVVQSIQGDTCSVQVMHTALVIDGITIPALDSADPMPNQYLAGRPSIGSTVLIGTMQNTPGEILLMQIIRADTVFYQANDTQIAFSGNSLTVYQSGSEPKTVPLQSLL
ncbi:hypothetical protein [Spirosoma aerolatum]|uniref:hypothetical protein n=1 Tax=Spirosoma aerolatum TaxID=1211326 RepID=UPI0009ACAFD7|nr:hypothetical protein [Spirosoma aerolatum]